MFLNIALLPRIAETSGPRFQVAGGKLQGERTDEVDTCQTRTIPGETYPIWTSAGFGVLEVAIRHNSGVEQLFVSLAIARRIFSASFAIPGRRHCTGKVGKAPEIAHVTQRTLQSLCRPMQMMEFAATP
jgi:hypothetical protein